VPIPVGQKRSAGREGDIELLDTNGRPVLHLSAEAYFISAETDHWRLDVPASSRFEVKVTDEDSGIESRVRPGSSGRTFRMRSALLEIDAQGPRLRVRVNAAGMRRQERKRTGTAKPPFVLDPDNRNHRPWIVACRDRIRRGHGSALGWNEVAAELRRAGRWDDADLNDEAARQRAQALKQTEAFTALLVAAGLDGYRLSADPIVDLLVRTGVVAEDELSETIGNEVSR
jgi:hypothetical protein